MSKKSWLRFLALLGALALMTAACGGDDEDEPGAGGDGGDQIDCTWAIGTLGALSGDFASLGLPISEGVEFAINEANDAGDVPCELEYVAEDSQGSPDQAPQLAQSLVETENLVGIAGPYFSGETLATGDIFTQANVVFSGTGTNETIDEQEFESWYRAVAPDNVQAEVAAAYLEEGLGAQKVAVMHDNQDYSKGLADGVLDNLTVEAQGGFIINPEETDYSAVVSEVADYGPDTVYYGGYTPQAGPLLQQLREAGVDVQFLSGDGSKDPSFGELAGAQAAEGAQVTCPCTDPLKQEAASAFVEGMQAEYGENAPGTFAADMYDVTNFMIDALRELNGDEPIEEVRQHVIDHFENAEGLEGVAKTYTWDDTGEFEGGPEDIWIYEWSNADENFISIGPASEELGE
ncbi:MAG: branched-chain amino acid ABC transporter substrate-binding protein [Actinomycetota bacterium]